MRSAELMGQRRATNARARSRGWSCYSAFRVPPSALFAVAFLAASQSPDPWPMLDRASATYQTITSLSAEFIQIITNPMIGTPDTTRGRLYQMRPSRFAMRFTAPKGDRIVADGRFLWLYTPSTTPGQVIRSRIPEYGTTGPNLIGQFVEQPRERYTSQYVPADSLPDASPVDVIRLVPNGHEQPYSEAKIWAGRADGRVHRGELVESSGRARTVMLRNIRVNRGVPGRELTFSPPAGIRVVDQ